MHEPHSFADPNYPNHVCLLNKARYGLKQSPCAWFHTLNVFLLSTRFIASRYDPSLFILHSNNQTVIILIYVDDIIMIGTFLTSILHVINQLHLRFAIKDISQPHYFLGIQVTHTSQGLHLSQ
jgi:Reverse transcriptase (RNA-dependent DNA polymerase)